jgi:hypothetical protein
VGGAESDEAVEIRAEGGHEHRELLVRGVGDYRRLVVQAFCRVGDAGWPVREVSGQKV